MYTYVKSYQAKSCGAYMIFSSINLTKYCAYLGGRLCFSWPVLFICCGLHFGFESSRHCCYHWMMIIRSLWDQNLMVIVCGLFALFRWAGGAMKPHRLSNARSSWYALSITWTSPRSRYVSAEFSWAIGVKNECIFSRVLAGFLSLSSLIVLTSGVAVAHFSCSIGRLFMSFVDSFWMWTSNFRAADWCHFCVSLPEPVW